MEALLEFLDSTYDDSPTTALLAEIYESDCDMVVAAQYRVIAEHYFDMSGDQEILTEGFVEFAKSAADWFKRLAQAIIKFFKQFISVFTDWSLNLKDFCKKHKDDLLAAKDFKVSMPGYKFTVLNSKKPDMSVFDKLVSEYNAMLSDIEDLEDKDIIANSKKFLDTDNIDKIRGDVLGAGGHIEAENYRAEVRRYYRDGSDSETDITWTSKDISDIVNHADTLFDAKKQAIADRDRIITLLTKAQNFFGDTIVADWQRDQKQIKGRSLDIDSSSSKIGVGEEKRVGYDSNIAAYNALMSSKYTEAKTIATIINTVVTERANALRDQVKQERKLVGMAAKPRLKMEESADPIVTDEEVMAVESDGGIESATDYCQVALEYMIDEGPVVDLTTLQNMCAEAIWMEEMISNGYSGVVMEGVLANIKKSIVEFFQKIIGMFRGKGKTLNTKYAPWLADEGVVDNIKANAPKSSFNLLDYWSGDHNKQLNDLRGLVARSTEEPRDPEEFEPAREYLGETNIAKINGYKKNGKDMMNILKNYFRNGKPGVDKMDQTTLAGTQLTQKCDTMVNYISDYDKFTEKMVDLDAAAKNLKVQESLDITPNTYLILENRRVFETDLAIILEAGAPGNEAATKANADAQKKTTNATQVTANNDGKNDDNNAADAGQTNDGGANEEQAKMSEYYKFALDFTKKAVSAYLSVCEERLITYVNLLRAMCDGEHKPVFRDNHYVSIKDREKARKEDTAVKDNHKEEEPKQNSRLQRAKEKVGNALSNAGKKLSGAKESTNIDDAGLIAVYDKPTRGFDWMN